MLESVVYVKICDGYGRVQRVNVELVAGGTRGAYKKVVRKSKPSITRRVIAAARFVADEHAMSVASVRADDEPLPTGLAQRDNRDHRSLARSFAHRYPSSVVAMKEGSELLHGRIKIRPRPFVKENRAL
jgi:hypothetical protein